MVPVYKTQCTAVWRPNERSLYVKVIPSDPVLTTLPPLGRTQSWQKKMLWTICQHNNHLIFIVIIKKTLIKMITILGNCSVTALLSPNLGNNREFPKVQATRRHTVALISLDVLLWLWFFKECLTNRTVAFINQVIVYT